MKLGMDGTGEEFGLGFDSLGKEVGELCGEVWGEV